jgi:hypothetical protein
MDIATFAILKKDAVASLSEGQTLAFCRESANFWVSAFPAHIKMKL